MSRPVEDIKVDIAEAKADRIRASERLRELEQELDERRVEDAQAEPHPWLGKRVKYEDTQRVGGYGTWNIGSRSSRKVTFRGTVAIQTRETRRNIVGLGYTAVGDPIVISRTGKKGWPLHFGWVLDEETSN